MDPYSAAAMAGLELAGSYFAAQNMRETAKLNQEIAEMNAEFAELDAYDARMEGYSQQARYQSVVDRTLSDQRAIAEAKGIDTSFGTAAAIEKEDRFTAELNFMEIQKRAEERALGFENQASGFRTKGAINRSQADFKAGQLMYQGVMGAGKTALSGY